MQALTASCTQQRFSLAQCCDSNDKKSRRRRTREERRTMVDSFITKYRISNNGKFPSLNLTHKEVGGSFYIVREIVRDIIQENRILGPGSPTMKGLSLEDCSEEHEKEFLESIAVDVKQVETSFQLHSNNYIVESVTADKEEVFSSDQENHEIFSHAIHQGHSCLQENSRGADDHKSLVTLESQEMAMGMSSVGTDTCREIGLQVQVDSERCDNCQIELPKPLQDTVSQKVLVGNMDSQANYMILSEAGNMSIGDDEMYKTIPMDALPEEKVLVRSSTSDHFFSNLLSEEEFPLLVSSTKSGSDSGCLTVNDLIERQEILVTQNLPNEQGESSVQIDNISILDKTEQMENPFSISNKLLSEHAYSESQASCFPAPGIPCSEEPPAQHVLSTESSRLSSDIVAAESFVSSAQETSANPLKNKHEKDCSSTDKGTSREMGSCSSSIAENGREEEIQSEGNPVWNAIKGFVAAIIKFWAQ